MTSSTSSRSSNTAFGACTARRHHDSGRGLIRAGRIKIQRPQEANASHMVAGSPKFQKYRHAAELTCQGDIERNLRPSQSRFLQ